MVFTILWYIVVVITCDSACDGFYSSRAIQNPGFETTGSSMQLKLCWKHQRVSANRKEIEEEGFEGHK